MRIAIPGVEICYYIFYLLLRLKGHNRFGMPFFSLFIFILPGVNILMVIDG